MLECESRQGLCLLHPVIRLLFPLGVRPRVLQRRGAVAAPGGRPSKMTTTTSRMPPTTVMRMIIMTPCRWVDLSSLNCLCPLLVCSLRGVVVVRGQVDDSMLVRAFSTESKRFTC
jgi:hypothetical protein